jgi:DNA processing protein
MLKSEYMPESENSKSDSRLSEEICEEIFYRIWLNNIEGIHTGDFRKLISVFSSAKNVYGLDYDSLSSVLSAEKSTFIRNGRDLSKASALVKKFNSEGITVLCPGHPDYPDKLLCIDAPPELLYVQGHIPASLNDTKSNVAIIGARNPDAYGREYALYFAEKLSHMGFNIISGLARGIDGCSHQGALNAGGYTVGVLGCGLNHIYPRENYKLYNAMSVSGAIITEYPPDAPPLASQFPERNRIISGLSDGVLVVEARKKSGSLITCHYALNQGKPVFAIPGRISDGLSEGTNTLIYDGAMCVCCPEDVAESIRCEVFDRKSTQAYDITKKLNNDEKKIYSILSMTETYIDEIIERSKLGVTKSINTLLALREKGVIKETVKGYYIICIS